MNIGVVFASTGGNKVVRTVRSFQRMEPGLTCHIVMDMDSNTYKLTNQIESSNWLLNNPGVRLRAVHNKAHINGALNQALRWMAQEGYEYACLFHDDLVFSHLPIHRGSLSAWFSSAFITRNSSGLRFSHFETFVPDLDSRRHADEWDKEDLESDELWKFLSTFTRIDGTEIRPPGRSFWFKYEGPDINRKWNRLGPTGQIVPIKTWKEVGEFDEKDGIFYDQEYPSECYRRGLPPVYSVTNFPYIHLHNQSMNPWGDPAPGLWGDTMKAFGKRFERRYDKPDPWAAFWGDDWERLWV